MMKKKGRWSMAKHFPAPWVDGIPSDAIVAKQMPEGYDNTTLIEEYGGYLVAETVAPCNKPLIKRAPSMLGLLEKAWPIIAQEAERREDWGERHDAMEHQYVVEMRQLANEIAQEIDKARGKGVFDG